MKMVILLVLIAMASSYRMIQYEYGKDNTVTFQGRHVLEAQNSVPRSTNIVVKFKKPFQVLPQVAAIPILLDWTAGLPHGFRVEAVDIELAQFKIRISAVAPLQLYSVYVSWFAVYDPRIQILNFETTELPTLKLGSGERAAKFNLPINFPEVSAGVAFLTGVKHNTVNYIVDTLLESVTPKVATVKIGVYAAATIEMARLVVILGTEKSLWASKPIRFYAAPGSNNPFVKRDPAAATNVNNFDLPAIWQSGQRLPLVGFNGYDVEKDRNMRLNIGDYSLEKQLVSKVTTWWDSISYGVFHQAAVYAYDGEMKLFDPLCAELFSECDFGGDSITVCDRNPDLPAGGWSKPVKSVSVPARRILYLFNKEKYNGQKAAYTSSQKCLDSITFSFVQLVDEEQPFTQQ